MAAVGAWLQSLDAMQVTAKAGLACLQSSGAADLAFSESCVRSPDRCTDWALVLPRGAAHVLVQGCYILWGWHCWSFTAQRRLEGGCLISLRFSLRAAALTAWTSQSCSCRAVAVCSYMPSSACC